VAAISWGPWRLSRKAPDRADPNAYPLGIFTRIIDLPAFVFLFIWIGMQVLSEAARDASRGGGGVAYMLTSPDSLPALVLIFVFE
jgi:hypothetical protein